MQLKLHHCVHNRSLNSGSRLGTDIESHMFTLEVGVSKRKYFIDNGSGNWHRKCGLNKEKGVLSDIL